MQILTLAVVALIAFPAFAIEKCGSGPRVTCVVDGDTFWLDGEKIRMEGYDTPEPTTNICGGAREVALAQRASDRLVELFNTTEITLHRHGEDRYGRTLAKVRSNGTPIGDILIREGLARRYPDGCEFWCQPCG
jgi:micrococcal nuclease